MSGNLREFTQIITRLDGRDKVNMLIQEIAKFSFFYLSAKTKTNTTTAAAVVNPELLLKIQKFYSGISLARSVDRLFNSSKMIQSMIDVLQSKEKILPKSLKFLISLLYCIFFYYDNKIFLGLIGVFTNLDYADLGSKAYKLWFFAVSLTLVLLILGMLSTQNIVFDKHDEQRNDYLKSKALFDIRVKIIKYLCDFLTAATGSGVIALDDRVVALLGICSAAIDLFLIKRSLAAQQKSKNK